MNFGEFAKFYNCTEEEIRELQLYYCLMLIKNLTNKINLQEEK